MEELEIKIYVPDATYDIGDEDGYHIRSNDFRKGLEAEFGQSFEESNSGAGADMPAYVTSILSGPFPYVAAAPVCVFQGKGATREFRRLGVDAQEATQIHSPKTLR